VVHSYLARALGGFRAPKDINSGGRSGVEVVARTWGQDKKAHRILNAADREVPGRTGKAEVDWEPERPTVVQMTARDYDAIFPARRDSEGD
jgi:hypothetical protein